MTIDELQKLLVSFGFDLHESKGFPNGAILYVIETKCREYEEMHHLAPMNLGVVQTNANKEIEKAFLWLPLDHHEIQMFPIIDEIFGYRLYECWMNKNGRKFVVAEDPLWLKSFLNQLFYTKNDVLINYKSVDKKQRDLRSRNFEKSLEWNEKYGYSV